MSTTAVVVDAVTDYARAVVDGEIVTGKRVRQACERHLRNLERQDTDDFPYVFDPGEGERFYRFATYCRHIEGPFARQPVHLHPWQRFVSGAILGWRHRETGRRLYRKAYVGVARKNGKSVFLSILGIYMIVADREFGAQVHAAATNKEQARIVYDGARKMVARSPDLVRRLEAGRAKIEHLESDSYFVPLSKETKSFDGFNPHLGILDEYHAHPTADMYEVLESGMGQRLQPLLFIITTAGFDLSAPCYAEYGYCCQVLDGELTNERYFIYIAELDKEDSYQDETCWVKANPMLAQLEWGVEYLRAQLNEAVDDRRKMRNFLTKNMNLWVDQKDQGFMEMERWEACESPLPDLRDMPCYIGVDLSATTDLTSIIFEFVLPDKEYAVIHQSFMPEDRLKARQKVDKVDYRLWIEQGYMSTVEGAVVDQEDVADWVHERVSREGWHVVEVCVDPWRAKEFGKRMTDHGYTVVEVPQNMEHLCGPTKHLKEQTVYAGRLKHNGDPLLHWAMGNAVVRENENENYILSKRRSRERIDPASALVTSHARAMLRPPPKKRSVYETRGFSSL